MLDLGRQRSDLADRIAHHPVALACLLVGLACGEGRLLGIARDFLHRGGHLVHGGGDLVGFLALGLYTGAGLRGHRRQLLGGRGDLADAAADPSDQVAQAFVHPVHRVLQLADLVTPGTGLGVGQIARRHAFGLGDGIAQRANDHAGDGQRGKRTDDNRQAANQRQQQVDVRALRAHRFGGQFEGLARGGDHLAGEFGHSPFGRQAIAAVLAKFIERGAVLLERCQSRVHRSLLLVVEPDLQVAADRADIAVLGLPIGHRLLIAAGDEGIFQGAHVEHLLGQARCRLGDGQRIAALQAVALQPQGPHRVVHVELDELELFPAALRGFAHLRTQLLATVDQLTVFIELRRVGVDCLANARQAGLLRLVRGGAQRVQLAVDRREPATQFGGGTLLTGQRKVALVAARIEDAGIDAGQLVDALRAGDGGLDGVEAGGGDRQRQRQHRAETNGQLAAHGQVGERVASIQSLKKQSSLQSAALINS